MTERSIDELGPVDYLVVEFPAGQQNFTGEAAEELLRLHDAGIIRVMDLVIVGKGDDGTIMAQELGDLDNMGEFERLETELAETLAEEDVLENIPDADVKEALESIPENFRMAVLLADVEGFAYKEIAEITGVPIGTVMSRLHRGRKALEKALYAVAKERGLVDG